MRGRELRAEPCAQGIGISDDLARGSIRMGIGRFTTAEEVDRAAEYIINAVTKLKQLAG